MSKVKVGTTGREAKNADLGNSPRFKACLQLFELTVRREVTKNEMFEFSSSLCSLIEVVVRHHPLCF